MSAKWPRLIALAVALSLGGWLIGSPPTNQPAVVGTTARPATMPVAATTSSGSLRDGSSYTPWLYANVTTSIGTANTADGSASRVVIRSGVTEREVQRIPSDRYPEFLGFVSAGDDVFWAEVSVLPNNGPTQTRIMRASWTRTGPAVPLTADTGASVFFNSQYDLVVAKGRVWWAAAAPTDALATEVRSVPIAGGKVTMRTVPGPYELSMWPWLQSAGGADVPLHLLNYDTGQQVPIARSAAELVACTPQWCRSILQSAQGTATRFDVMHPDGSDRRRIAGANAAAVSSDVAFLGRYEVLTVSEGQRQDLTVYDITTRTTTTVAKNVGMVLCRGGMLWWSTGDKPGGDGVEQWHTVDMRTLTSPQLPTPSTPAR
jgi:hypothetical protein